MTWSAPTTVLTFGDSSEEGGFDDIRLAAQADGPRLYMALSYDGYHGRFLYFTSSSSPGSQWSPIKRVAVAFPDEGAHLRGVALAAGRGGTVLLAYGWSEVPSNYIFSMQVARSRDHGDSFLYGTAERRSAAIDDGSLVLSQPDIAIGQAGTAHLVYARGSNAVFYKYSLPPYQTWSATAARLDDEVPAAQLYAPRLAVGDCGPASVLHATWGQRRTGTNNVLYARKVAQTGYGWSAPLTIVASSGGGGINEIAGTGSRAFSVSFRDPIMFGSRAWSGVTCP